MTTPSKDESDRIRAAYYCRFPWKKLEMEEQAHARHLMRRKILRLAYFPYALGEHRLEEV